MSQSGALIQVSDDSYVVLGHVEDLESRQVLDTFHFCQTVASYIENAQMLQRL